MTLQIGFLTERLILGFGVDLAVHQYASFLQEQGYGVTVFCERHEPIVERKYKVIDLAHRTDLVRTGSMGRNLVNFARFFNAFPMDIWIVNTPPFYDVIPLLLAPCIAIEYGTPPQSFFRKRSAAISMLRSPTASDMCFPICDPVIGSTAYRKASRIGFRNRPDRSLMSCIWDATITEGSVKLMPAHLGKPWGWATARF